MTIQHPYCRTCGSKVRSKSVCHHCGCEPAKGQNYCCDCGTTTIAHAIMCVECGASLQKRFPAALAILISCALIITFVCTGYFISQSQKETPENIETIDHSEKTVETKKINKKDIVAKNELGDVIKNKIPENILRQEIKIPVNENILPEKNHIVF